jgi:hypothetical protein
MSSSRSIAAARNRRAGDPPSTNNRPGTSINSQPAFSSQTKSQTQSKFQQNVTVQNSTPNVPVSSTSKLTISDAIGLITLRLGRVEQILQDAEHNGGLSVASNSILDNAHLIDKSVINSIVNRLDSLEKKEKETSSNTKFDTEIRTIKDLLMNQILKYDKNTIDTDKKLADIDAAFVEIEKVQETQDQTINDLLNRLPLKTDILEEKTDVLLETEEKTDVLLETEVKTDVLQTNIKFDLKNAVSEELAMACRF